MHTAFLAQDALLIDPSCIFACFLHFVFHIYIKRHHLDRAIGHFCRWCLCHCWFPSHHLGWISFQAACQQVVCLHFRPMVLGSIIGCDTKLPFRNIFSVVRSLDDWMTWWLSRSQALLPLLLLSKLCSDRTDSLGTKTVVLSWYRFWCGNLRYHQGTGVWCGDGIFCWSGTGKVIIISRRDDFFKPVPECARA